MDLRGFGPDDIPGRLPIEVDPDVRSPAGWRGLTLRAHRSPMLDEAVPPLRDHLITAYRGRRTWVERRLQGRWSAASLGPGDFSLQTRGLESRWMWSGRIDVVNVFLEHDELVSTAREMYAREVDDIVLTDHLDVKDVALHRIVAALRQEASADSPGSRLMVDTLTTELEVTLLRGYAHVSFREQQGPGVLTFCQQRRLHEYVAEHLQSPIGLDELAGVVLLSRFHFTRVFRRTTGLTPHEFVLRARIEQAQLLLRTTNEPIGTVAGRCGFADHSHLARVFRGRLGVTPSHYRAQAS